MQNNVHKSLLLSKFRLLIFAILILTLNSCQKKQVPIDFISFSENLPDIVVDGAVLSIHGRQFIRLTKPHNTNSTNTLIPISNAKISLFDGTETFLYKESETLGEYFTIDSILPLPGKKYTLTIDINGKKYTATDEMKYCDDNLQPPIKSILKLGNQIDASSSFHNFGYNNNNIWCINIYKDTLGVLLDYLNPKTIVTHYHFIYTFKTALPQGLFAQSIGSTSIMGENEQDVEYIKLSVSDNFNKYIISMFNLTKWSSGIFSTIPENTYTNFSGGAIGYFYASDVKKIRCKFKDLKAVNE